MESYLVAGAFFLMVFTPAIVGARNSARENRLSEGAGEQPRRRFRLPSLSSSLSNLRHRRQWAAPHVALEDPLQALALETVSEAAPEPISPAAVVAAATQPAVYVKNFTFNASRFNQPERHQSQTPIQIAAVHYAPAELAMQSMAAEAAAEVTAAHEVSTEEAPVSYGDPEPLYVRRAVYGQRLPRFAAQAQEPAREEMVPYPYAPPFAHPAQASPYMPQYPMAGQVMPPMPQQGYPQMPHGYPQMPHPAMGGMPFPNPYLYPMAFMPMYPMGFYPMPMPGPGYGMQQPSMGSMGPQLVEPYQPQQAYPGPGYANQQRWEHRSTVPYRSLFRRA